MQNAQQAGRPHRNHGLFSDHYLNVTLPARLDWKALAVEARPVIEEIASLLDSYTASENEAQLEEELMRPILRLLGHTFEVQPALANPDGTKFPDYVLYKNADAVAANKGKILTDELLNGSPFAVADAKYWGRPLDASLKHVFYLVVNGAKAKNIQDALKIFIDVNNIGTILQQYASNHGGASKGDQ
jgi:hypothetical protein